MFASLFLVLAASASYADAQLTLAGYRTLTDVTNHSRVDLDQRDMEVYLDLPTADFVSAKNAYEVGGNSVKSSGAIRTLAGFSTGAPGKLDGETLYELYKAYWGSGTYADDFVRAALDGTAPFNGMQDVSRGEYAAKGASYQNTWMYVIHEMEDAILDCIAGDISNNGGAVLAWDEAWAFYAGSAELGDGSTSGFQPYALAEKRCKNFATCNGDTDGDPTTGKSTVNQQLLALYAAGQQAILNGNCGGAASILRDIVPLMTVPLVQGVLRYAYLGDPNGGAKTPVAKQRAEGWAFLAAVMPQLDYCSSTIAAQIRTNMEYTAENPGSVVDGYATVYGLVHQLLPCLGMTCADVGGYVDVAGPNPVYFTGAEPCQDALPTTLAGPGAPVATDIAGYQTLTDVTNHSRVDLDQRDMEVYLDLPTADFVSAKNAYEVGGNSVKSSGAIRTLAGFSTGAPGKLDGETLYELYKAYWGSGTYADDFVRAALDGTAPFNGMQDVSRGEYAAKGASYQNTWMYVIHEMEDAILDCIAGDISNNGGAVLAWDEAWAFYAGSAELGDGSTSGFQPYALAEKRCKNFATCNGDTDGDPTTGKSTVNQQLLALYAAGQQAILNGNCGGAASILRDIVPLMTVPLVQGVLRYAYLGDPNGGAKTPVAKQRAEGWAFLAAVMPQLDYCSSTIAAQIRTNMEYTAENPGSVVDGYATVYGLVHQLLPCLGMTCADVGGYVDVAGPNPVYFTGAEPCQDALPTTLVGPAQAAAASGSSGSGDEGLGADAVVGITIAVAVVCFAAGVAALYFVGPALLGRRYAEL